MQQDPRVHRVRQSSGARAGAHHAVRQPGDGLGAVAGCLDLVTPPALLDGPLLEHCRKLGRPLLSVSQGTLRDLQAHDWPGNVRELEAVIERAVITSTGEALRIGDAPGPGAPAGSAAAAPPGSAAAAGAKTLSDLERDHIVATLEKTYWRLEGEAGAAARLGINPSTLRSRMRKHGIRRPAPSEA